MNRRAFVKTVALTGAYSVAYKEGLLNAQQLPGEEQPILIEPDKIVGPLPHFWEECIGSDRAAVGMRQQWLTDLERAKAEVGVKSVRFHGLFDDEMGVWTGASKAPNFLYLDIVFDAMIERGIKPLVELSFMPGALASGTRTAFYYRGNVTPPADFAQWAELIRAFSTHCVERYGIAEVSTWNFEVWNEPNLPYFWSGTKEDYFELYRQAALAIKAVDSRLRVGGPATAQAAWVTDFLQFCSAKNIPVDFVSTHIYPDDPQTAVFGDGIHYSFEEVIPNALAKLKQQIKASKTPGLPLYITEWSSQNPAFIAYTLKSCVGLANIMSYWTFDNIFEELGLPKTFMNKSFGLIGFRGIPRASFHTFALLHRLGNEQIGSEGGPVWATRRQDGSLAIMVWNLIPLPPGTRTSMGNPVVQNGTQYLSEGASKRITLRIEGHKAYRALITRVDGNNGDLDKAYQDIGSPKYPTLLQIEQLKTKSKPGKGEVLHMNRKREISFDLLPNGVALLELS